MLYTKLTSKISNSNLVYVIYRERKIKMREIFELHEKSAQCVTKVINYVYPK